MAKSLSNLSSALLIGLAALLLAGCETSFTGSPYVDGGRKGCEAKCQAQNMEIAGLVYMGEYSDACVCMVPGTSAMRRKLLMAKAGAAAGMTGALDKKERENVQRMLMQNH